LVPWEMRPGVNVAHRMHSSRAAHAGVVSCFTGQFDRAPEIRSSAEIDVVRREHRAPGLERRKRRMHADHDLTVREHTVNVERLLNLRRPVPGPDGA